MLVYLQMDFISIVNDYFIDWYRQTHHKDIILASFFFHIFFFVALVALVVYLFPVFSVYCTFCFLLTFSHILTSFSSFSIILISWFKRYFRNKDLLRLRDTSQTCFSHGTKLNSNHILYTTKIFSKTLEEHGKHRFLRYKYE